MSEIFELDHENSFIGDVEIPLPGKQKPKILTLKFKWMSKTDKLEYLKNVSGKDDLTALKEIVLGWENVKAKFTDDSMAKLLDNYGNAGLIILNYWITETAKAKEKNS
jgi:hypothetical protein